MRPLLDWTHSVVRLVAAVVVLRLAIDVAPTSLVLALLLIIGGCGTLALPELVRVREVRLRELTARQDHERKMLE